MLQSDRLPGEQAYINRLRAAQAANDAEGAAAVLMELRQFYAAQPPIRDNDPRIIRPRENVFGPVPAPVPAGMSMAAMLREQATEALRAAENVPQIQVDLMRAAMDAASKGGRYEVLIHHAEIQTRSGLAVNLDQLAIYARCTWKVRAEVQGDDDHVYGIRLFW